MKLLREFLRLRTGGGYALGDRRAALRRPLSVTVPQPLARPAEPVLAGRPEALKAVGHLSLVSSR